MLDGNYGENFIINCGIMSIFPAQFDRVLEVLENEEDYISDEVVDEKYLCYYIMNIGIMEGKKALFEKPNPVIVYNLKSLFIRVEFDGILVNKVFMDGGSLNLMPCVVVKKMGKC